MTTDIGLMANAANRLVNGAAAESGTAGNALAHLGGHLPNQSFATDLLDAITRLSQTIVNQTADGAQASIPGTSQSGVGTGGVALGQPCLVGASPETGAAIYGDPGERRDTARAILDDPGLTPQEKYQGLRGQGFTTDEVDRYAGWEPGTAAAYMREFEGVSSANQVLDGIRSGRWSAEDGVRLLHGIGGSPEERLQFGRDAADFFAGSVMKLDDAHPVGWHGGHSTAGIWDALLTGGITAEDAIQSSQAKVSRLAANTPGFGTSPSGSGTLYDFSMAELLANVDEASASSINAKVWMRDHNGVPPKLSEEQMVSFMDDYNAPVPQELQFLLDVPSAAGIGRGLGYQEPAGSRVAGGGTGVAAASGRLLGVS